MSERERELERTTELRGFRSGLHDLFAEVDLDELRKTNDRVEANYTNPAASLLDRRTRELVILGACMGQSADPSHLQMHMHAAVKDGSSEQEIWELIKLLKPTIGATAMTRAYEAWRAAFRPELPAVDRIVELR
jgi:alkylhydroperoxidase/carboxymuconolactone decarboxylase family protein YurZ